MMGKLLKKQGRESEKNKMESDDFLQIEQYLADTANYDKRSNDSELWVTDTLKSIKTKAVASNSQDIAKKAWCYETIHEIQKKYLLAFGAMKEGRFYDGWCLLERVEIATNSLEKHFPLLTDDVFKIDFIDKQVNQLQNLFPYRMFMSPAFIHLEKECSICSSKVSIWNSCGHKKGEIYNGEMCVHVITKANLLEISVVPNPVQKYSVLFLSDPETGKEVDHYDYSLVNYVITALQSPFDGWEAQKTKIRHPHSLFAHIKKSDNCPCESGKQYKNCCLKNKEGVLRPHMNIIFHSKPNIDLPKIMYPTYKSSD